MAENSNSSTRKEKPSTGKTSKLTPDQALEILAKAVLYCQEAGIDVRAPTRFYDAGQECVVIVLANVRLTENRRLLAVEGHNE